MPFISGDPLVLTYWNGTCWVVSSELDYIIDDNSKVIVPKGFITDLASVPQIFWNIFPPQGGSGVSYAPAAVVHDYLYKYAHATDIKTNQFKPITRYQADCVIYQAMKDLNVPTIVAYSIYLGVRLGGFVAWNNWRKLDKPKGK